MEENESPKVDDMGSVRVDAWVRVPAKPEPERIESMCFRYDHSHGLKNWGETDEAFERRRESHRIIMRQLYEEATGQGFFRPHDAA